MRSRRPKEEGSLACSVMKPKTWHGIFANNYGKKRIVDGFSEEIVDNLEAIANRLDQILSLAEQRETGN